MNRNQIMEVITKLSYSQGFYGRLKSAMTDEALDYLEAQNFKDSIDLILFFDRWHKQDIIKWEGGEIHPYFFSDFSLYFF